MNVGRKTELAIELINTIFTHDDADLKEVTEALDTIAKHTNAKKAELKQRRVQVAELKRIQEEEKKAKENRS